jgi:hypothetical protein
MDWESAFKIVVGVCGALGAFVLNNINSRIERQASADAELAKDLQKVELLVAGEYVRREDMKTLSDAIFSKLDRIENKLDGKMDKS